MRNWILAMQTSALDQIVFDGLKGNTFFSVSLFQKKAVIKIFPESAILAKIDLNGYLAAFFVGQKLDTNHEVT
jgi:hypothetical protein